jgi:hypothetical protein
MGKCFLKCKMEGKEVPTCEKLVQLKMILFNNPNNKKFVITNFSTCLNDYRMFEKKVCPIEKVVTFKKHQELVKNPYTDEIPNLKANAHEVFLKYDLDGNGKLDRSELIKMFTELYKMYPFDADDKIDDLLDDEDRDDNNFVEENEWVNYSAKLLKK